MKRPEPCFGTEAELCDAFVAELKPHGYRIYPEQDGWDLVVVDARGRQTGVQAKLRANLEVLGQALRESGGPRSEARRGPDSVALLVGSAPAESFERIATSLGFGIVYPRRMSTGVVFTGIEAIAFAPLLETTACLDLPEVEVGMSGGCPSPKSVTKWKLAAVGLCLRLRRIGMLTPDDFRNAGVSRTRWVQFWLDGARDPDAPRRVIYTARPGASLPDEQYPEIVAALKAAGKET
jgi:hypothetical protein